MKNPEESLNVQLELSPTEEEMAWWEEAQDAAEEAEGLVSWLDDFIRELDPTLRAGRYAGSIAEKVSNLKQTRDSLAHAWGLNIKPGF